MSWVGVGTVGGLVISGWAANEQSKAGKDASKDARKATEAQVALGREQLDYLKSQDELRQGLGSAWYDGQRNIAEQEDARRFGILPQLYDNASISFDETMANAGLFYDEATGLAYDANGQMVGNAEDLYSELTGNAAEYGGAALDNAYEYGGEAIGNADRMYDELTGNARYSDTDYQAATDAASADVVQSFGKARDMTRRNMMRYGGNPNSSDFARFESGSALDQAAAEAGAVNTTRRSMKSEERGRLNDAILRGLTARAGALESGYGAVDSATRYAGGMNADAFTTGRGAIDSAVRGGAALRTSAVGAGRSAIDSAIQRGRGGLTQAMMTNLGTSSAQLGLTDPRIGIVSQTTPGYSTVAGALGNQASYSANNAAQYNQNATDAMASAGQAAGQIAGYYYGRNRTPSTPAAPASSGWYNNDTGMSGYADNQERY